VPPKVVPIPVALAQANAPDQSDTSTAPEYCAVVTIRIDTLFGKLGISDDAKALRWFKAASRRLGMPLTGVERITCVLFKDKGLLWLIESAQPLPERAIVAAYLPRAELIPHQHKHLHASSERNAAGKSQFVLYFATERLLIAGPEEVVKQWRGPLPAKAATLSTFGDIWDQATKHDIVAWSQDKVLKETYGIDAALATVDIGDRLTTEVRCCCADTARARQVAKVLRGYCDLFRTQVLMLCCMAELGQNFPGGPGMVDRGEFVPVRLLRRFDKGLQHAATRAEGTTAVLTATVAVDGKTLRTEVETVIRRLSKSPNSSGGITLPFPFFFAESPQSNTPSGTTPGAVNKEPMP
jgi:hypothetical protein